MSTNEAKRTSLARLGCLLRQAFQCHCQILNLQLQTLEGLSRTIRITAALLAKQVNTNTCQVDLTAASV